MGDVIDLDRERAKRQTLDDVKRGALWLMKSQGELFVSLDNPHGSPFAGLAAMMICQQMARDGLCVEDRFDERLSSFTITHAGRQIGASLPSVLTHPDPLKVS